MNWDSTILRLEKASGHLSKSRPDAAVALKVLSAVLKEEHTDDIPIDLSEYDVEGVFNNILAILQKKHETISTINSYNDLKSSWARGFLDALEFMIAEIEDYMEEQSEPTTNPR